MPHNFRLILPVFFLLLAGCSHVPNELQTAERIMDTHPDSALHILQQIPPGKKMSESNRALYGLLLLQALDNNNKKLQPDSLIDFSISHYIRENDNPHLSRCYFYKGCMLMGVQHYDEATVLLLKALDYLKYQKNYALLGRIYANLGDISSIQMDYKESRKKYLLALENSNRSGKTKDANYAILSIGRTYHFEKDFKTAQQYYQKALAHSIDSMLVGAVYQDIGINFYSDEQLDSAQLYLQKSLLYPFKGNSYAIRCRNLADVFFNKELLDSAYHYATLALKYPINFFTQRECYRILINIEFRRKDIKQMGIYMSHFQSCTDSIREVESQTKSTVLEALHKTTEDADSNKKQNTILGILIFVILALGFKVLYKMQKHHKKENAHTEERLNEQKVNIRMDVMLKQRDTLLDKIEEIKDEQANERKKATPSARETMDRELYNHLIHFDDSEFFFRQMDAILNNLVSKLNSRYLAITPKEMTWCCLHLLNIPNSDMLLLLNYKPESLIKMKQRLAQKTKLTSSTDLNDFLHGILYEE